MGKQRFVDTLRDGFLLILSNGPAFFETTFFLSNIPFIVREGFRFAFHPKHYLATGI